MIIQIKNSKMKVGIDLLGAQLVSIEVQNREYLWQGNPDFWSGQAPLLFPVVGRYDNNEIKIDGILRRMNNHGFLRTLTFDKIEQALDRVVLRAAYNQETLTQYPFKFEIIVTYQLRDKELQSTYIIRNLEDRKMFYSFGLHPAFNCNTKDNECFEDYYLRLEKGTRVETLLFNKDLRVDLNQKKKIETYQDCLMFDHKMFERTLILKDISFHQVRLGNKKEGDYLNFTFKGFNIFAMWQPKGAPFICLEPWSGFDGIIQTFENLEESPLVQRLEAKEEKTYTMIVEVL